MKRVLKEVLGFSIYLLIVLVLTYLIIAFVGQRTVVHGESMENTLYDGDNLIVDKWTYRTHDPVRFDIVVFPYKYEKNTYYIKRVIGLPGESVRIDAYGNIYINDVLLEESYGREAIRDAGLAGNTVYLGADEYFVLGITGITALTAEIRESDRSSETKLSARHGCGFSPLMPSVR